MNISVIIQPGGSLRDQEVIEEATNKKIVMFFTNIRNFYH
ncbi:phosphoribosylaminoimidazolecarboxamide formyltransferase/IMP cyclohydrolase domain protein [Ehrlichia japonica]|uniref:Phosphoribosylaminoimidazolecarboxamide formyltransferase/IMP cyclohydrolase domain protein n=1 Tax=Ehrlichia japonica TaxID=391036 RepID=X5H2C7_9RICK|nr:phosphoribosylaminoimidazolecarboxamide formyltransferase/IMP cyclohydrolase domain protein [Ehrlichia japonica]AHX04811.1 phosphoribosylaminoimidazolecarboxamide formyltransferase/IMP cyclohydrolase domain protein [Ehrlichia japonica]